MNICNCQLDLDKYFCDIPNEWRKGIVDALCLVISPKGDDLTCKPIKDCETLTSLSPITSVSTTISITYTNENGTNQIRTFDMEDLVESSLDEVDPSCIMDQEEWDELTNVERLQSIILAACPCCFITTSTTTTTSTSTTTTTSTTSTTTTTTTTSTSTTTTTSTSTTTTTSTSTTTTSTTTLSPCMAEGFGIGEMFGRIFWSLGDVDTSGDVICSGNPVNQPSNDSAVSIAFFADAALTIPVLTSLNAYPITVGGNPYMIGDGSPAYAYFVDSFPHFIEPVEEPGCTPGPQEEIPLPTLEIDDCFTVVDDVDILGGDFTTTRPIGDSTAHEYNADMSNAIENGGTGVSGNSVGIGIPGPEVDNIEPCFGTINYGTSAPAGQDIRVTITGLANDGTTGETHDHLSVASPTFVSTKKYYLDSNHPITVVFDESPFTT